MKILSWNVNGLRACIKNGFLGTINDLDTDIVCVQEVKATEEQMADVEFGAYHFYQHVPTYYRGTSGLAILSKEKPLNIYRKMESEFDDMGRMITAEYPDFFLVTIYSPVMFTDKDGNKLGLRDYEARRMKWEDDLRKYVVRLRKKSVIICGDFNVSRAPIDCWDEDNHSKSQVGYTDGERTKMEELLNAGFIDTFRYLHPDSGGRYSWLSYRKDFIRHTNGLRLDYFLVSNDLKDRIGQSLILNDIKGSDHSPIELILR